MPYSMPNLLIFGFWSLWRSLQAHTQSSGSKLKGRNLRTDGSPLVSPNSSIYHIWPRPLRRHQPCVQPTLWGHINQKIYHTVCRRCCASRPRRGSEMEFHRRGTSDQLNGF
ncbi:hypothetical protein B0H14DRAFT_2705668 [Mycena olivaceomarginata]|nr:hypothetical protein B0H14DRAFT_2705668 [Mycena olivaceomarginata]